MAGWLVVVCTLRDARTPLQVAEPLLHRQGCLFAQVPRLSLFQHFLVWGGAGRPRIRGEAVRESDVGVGDKTMLTARVS